jgi:hypothetical protein
MNLRRKVLGTNPHAPRIPIPQTCVDSKTIYLSELDVLFLFKDTRQVARNYVEMLLPHLALQVPKDTLIEAFWKMPDNGWFEFEYTRKMLCYCSLEK